TGASSGIGEACAKVLASEARYRLLLCARRLQRLEALEKEIRDQYPACEIFSFELDVRNVSEVQEKLRHLPQEWNNIDILINNAGLSQGLDPIHKGDIGDWDRMIDTNVKGLLYVTKYAIPL